LAWFISFLLRGGSGFGVLHGSGLDGEWDHLVVVALLVGTSLDIALVSDG